MHLNPRLKPAQEDDVAAIVLVDKHSVGAGNYVGVTERNLFNGAPIICVVPPYHRCQ